MDCEKGSAIGWMLRATSISVPGVKPISAFIRATIRRLTACQSQWFCALVFQVLVFAVLWTFELEG